MVPVQSFENVPTFGTGATLVQPIGSVYSGGYLPGQLLPAEYENWMYNGLTGNANTVQTALNNTIAELVTILTAAAITPSALSTSQVKTALDALYLAVGGTAYDSSRLGGSLAALYAKLANPVFTGSLTAANPTFTGNLAASNPTFTGTVVVPPAAGATSPYQKQEVDAVDATLSASIAANALISNLNVTTNLSGAATTTLDPMAVGETRYVGLWRSCASSGSYTLTLPATGTYAWTAFGIERNGAGSIAFFPAATTEASAAGGSNIFSIGTVIGTVYSISVTVRRVS